MMTATRTPAAPQSSSTPGTVAAGAATTDQIDGSVDLRIVADPGAPHAPWALGFTAKTCS